MQHQISDADLAKLMGWTEHGAFLVIGDLMLDEYIQGTVTRVSPEAPVPVLRVRRKFYSAGGAANVAMNLRGLGCKVWAAGIIGADAEGCHLIEILKNGGVNIDAIKVVEGRPTTVKTRIQDGRQQMLRLDKEETHLFEEHCYAELAQGISKILESQEIDAIVLSDYNKGVLASSLCCAIIAMGRKRGLPVFVNSKGTDYSRYQGANMISVNRFELAIASGRDADHLDSLLEAGQAMLKSLQLDFLTLTLGDSGITLVQQDGVSHFPAIPRDVYDVSGAGDTVLATVATAVCAAITRENAVRFANAAAGIVIEKLGTSPITMPELIRSVESDHAITGKICTAQDLVRTVAHWRRRRDRIVFINGCFDLLHPGHIALIEQARNSGDRLIVALNTDRSVKLIKGPGRPVMNEKERAAMIAALACVDAVVLFDEPTPLELILRLHPDVLVKGGDYRKDEIVGAKEVEEWSGTVVIVPLMQGISTSSIIDRMSHRLQSSKNTQNLESC